MSRDGLWNIDPNLPHTFEWTATFEAVEGGTKVTFLGVGKPSGILRLAGPMWARPGSGGTETDAAALNKVLEAQA